MRHDVGGERIVCMVLLRELLISTCLRFLIYKVNNYVKRLLLSEGIYCYFGVKIMISKIKFCLMLYSYHVL